jgi:tagatose 6-phosphate kinase
MIDIICLNPAMDRTMAFQHIQLGQVHRSLQCITVAGGKGLNVARFFRQLQPDSEIRVRGFVGGIIGSYIREECRKYSFVDCFTEIADTTRVCSIMVDERLATVFNEQGPRVTEEEVQHFLAGLDEKPELVVISGSGPTGVPDTFYAKLVAYYKSKSIPVVLDASGAMLAHGVAAGPTLIKPNEDEFRELMGAGEGPLELDGLPDKCESLLSKGIEHIVVSLGARGAVLVSRGLDPVWFPALDIPVRNPIACGDALVAGMLYGWSQNASIVDIVRCGIAAASLNAMSLGPMFEDLDRYAELYSKVTYQTYVEKGC